MHRLWWIIAPERPANQSQILLQEITPYEFWDEATDGGLLSVPLAEVSRYLGESGSLKWRQFL
jgi:hypothetical protein